jgi:hypothetical protein
MDPKTQWSFSFKRYLCLGSMLQVKEAASTTDVDKPQSLKTPARTSELGVPGGSPRLREEGLFVVMAGSKNKERFQRTLLLSSFRSAKQRLLTISTGNKGDGVTVMAVVTFITQAMKIQRLDPTHSATE